jgi:hypothetical protein
MEKFIADLMNEIVEIEGDLFPPKGKVRENEKVVGEATEYMKKLWALGQVTMRELDNYKLDHKYNCPDEDAECGDFQAKCQRLNAKKELLVDLFYSSARENCGAWAESSVGLREGWKIVVGPPRSAPPEIEKLFGFLRIPPPE